MDETPEITRKVDEFKYCDSPTLFVVRADHLLHCPVWYDEIEPHPKGSLYQQIGLAVEHRTPDLKIFHATQAIMSNQFKPMVTTLLLAHLVATQNSRVYIVDGYPVGIMERISRMFSDSIKEIVDPKIKHGMHMCVSTVSAQDYTNTLSHLKAVASEDNQVCFILGEEPFSFFIPNIDNYNAALQETYKKQQQQKIMDAPVADRFKPYLIGGKDDPDQGGSLLQ